MATYSHTNFEEIAKAVGMEVGQIAKHRSVFEAAALWYRTGKRRPARTAPSNLLRRLAQVGKSARRLLGSLGVDSPDEAPDGPGDAEILDALVLADEPNADSLIEATRRIGRLVEIVDAVQAARALDRRTREAATEVAELGKLTVQSGNPGDSIVNDWVAAMMVLYRTITGREPATSVGAPERPNEGAAGGPLVRFLQAAGQPLAIEYSEAAWRSRVRTILKSVSSQN
jgi:hypothetical protein